MRIFQTEAEPTEQPEHDDINEKLDSLETLAEELRSSIGQRRNMLRNAEKTLQQFQDSMYAVLMEDEHFRRKYAEERRKKLEQEVRDSDLPF